MADNQTMAKLLQVPTEGYEDAIVILEIAANNFKLKHVFPPSKTTNLHNEITRFQQRFDESFDEAWDRFNDLLRACPHHGFSELHQLDTFYNALNINDQDSLNSAAVSALVPNLKSSIPHPSRRDNKRCRVQANEQIEKFYEIFKDMSFDISFTDALILMPKFVSTLKALIGNKEKLSEMARTPMNKHCSAVILNKLPRKLGDPRKFLIPCEFPGMDECLALADLGASINLMPLSVWEGLSLPKLTPTCMTLELADRSVSKPIDIIKDVSVKVEVFHFPADFVVVDFEPDPRVLLILGRCFLKTGRALIDVHKGELTLHIRNEAITYNLDQTSRYSANYNQMTANKIDVICEIYSQEVLGFFDVTTSGNPTPYDDPIVSTTSPTLTLFEDSDFLLFEEADSFLDKMLQRCEDTNLSLSWEKSHFMVRESIVLDHKISKNGIEVDRAKVDVIAKLPHPTTVKGAVLGQRHEKYFRPIHYASKTLTNAESNYTTTEKEMLAIVYAFEKFWSYLIMNKCIVHTDHSTLKYLFAKKDAKARLLCWVLLLQEFDFAVIDTKGAKNLATDHLSQLENPYENVLDPKEINENFPLETLSMVTSRGNSDSPWFADFANYHAGNF
nr:reverse transcriptase domain-containing protein [Tanacetum cinerariifolium]